MQGQELTNIVLPDAGLKRNTMSEKTPTPARLEAFSDGVIAVIITVMVLEIKVPHAEGFEGLRTLTPGLSVYLMSFGFTGIYWLNHQHIIRRTERADHSLQIANLGFLFCLSLLPLSTAYVVEKQLSGFAVSFYATSLLIVALSFMWVRLALHGILSGRDEVTDEDRRGLRNHVVSICLYFSSAVLAPFFPKLILCFIALLTFIWTLPNLSLTQVRQQRR
ncbi:Integral membrane protein (plasmid) [Acidisarcina polymorpha]|uniref:Integral membrane protein n=1 Tax=Acidisarcina polymorpha TaxID=2211140 RepID=A0A2Z5GB95_9BACT|nr:TMEM175 family protein [Acidisarcina polymorpha]AXC16269.1 Integral membrane protein [Acidisarcina polymorpha]